MITLVALAISTVLNAIYFMKTVIRIYTPAAKGHAHPDSRRIPLGEQPDKNLALVFFILLNVMLGLNSEPIVELIRKGLGMFS